MTTGRPLGVLQPGDPEQIGPYLIRARVGAGGMGVVYLGEAPNGRPVAVKVIQSALAQDKVFRDRFRREVASARKVRSRVTVSVLDADADSDNPWVAFEYVEGPNLQDVVEAGVPRMSATIGILTGIAEALVAIHQVGIIHRDLKPSNVLCPPDGVKVIDFGIAAALEATALTRTGLMGTPAWLAPEQITGQPVTPAVDVFAWGCIALYTLTGRLAFGGGEDSPPVLIYRVVNAEPDLSDVPDELIEPVSAALAKQPEDRPKVHEILRMMLPSRRVNPPIIGATPSEPGEDRQRDVITPAAAASVAAAMGAGGWRSSAGAATPSGTAGASWPGSPVDPSLGGTPSFGGATPSGTMPGTGPGDPSWPGVPADQTPPGAVAQSPPSGPGWPPSGPGPTGPPPWQQPHPPPPPPQPPPPPPGPPGGGPVWGAPQGSTVYGQPPGWTGAPGPGGGPGPGGPAGPAGSGPGGPGWQNPPGWLPPGQPPTKKSKLGLWIGIGVAAVAIIVVIAIIAASSGGGPKPVVLSTTTSVPSTTSPSVTATPTPTTAVTPQGVTPLAQLLPSDVDPAVDCTRNSSPATNLTGLTNALVCSPKHLTGGQIFAFQFDTAADYATSLASLNKFKGFDPSTAGSSCPPAADSQDSIGWHNNTFPSRTGQVLECLSVGTGNTQPDYIWTYPTENTIIDAQAADNSSFSALDAWWTKDAPPP